jgi:hypothetical protein
MYFSKRGQSSMGWERIELMRRGEGRLKKSTGCIIMKGINMQRVSPYLFFSRGLTRTIHTLSILQRQPSSHVSFDLANLDAPGL